jgi:rod shape determining protein RodA|uniref:Peptidoglycan glycosyltransferase RodA n=1 Tax=Chlorobium chlorochromatii (strain CaD3) TaxID=340177 RepID=Q3AT34_CHLCH
MLSNKRQKLDLWYVASIAGLILMGFMAVFSATYGSGDSTLFYRQVAWGGIGLIIMAFMYFNDARVIRDNAYIFYAIGLVLLVAVLIFGKKIAGQTSWMRIGFFSFQPSEIVKLTTIFGLARFLSDDNTDITNIPHLVMAFAIAFVPVLLIMLQPDMGTMLTIMPFIAVMLIMAGFDLYILILLAFPIVLMISGFFNVWVVVALAVVLLIALIMQRQKVQLHQFLVIGGGLAAGLFMHRFASEILKPHQLKRIQTFIDPMSDPQGAGYNALQAKIAITSGGLFGKGFLEGTQTQLRFIPAQWTDFIFCVIAEELGFIGAALLLSFYLIFILKLIATIFAIHNKFIQLTLSGFVSLIFIHVLINVGMTIGLIPVIGVPLPFVSYGGTSLVGNMIMAGLALNYARNKRSLGYYAREEVIRKSAP